MSFRNSSLAVVVGFLGLACAPAAFAADLDPALDDAPQVMPSLPQSNVVFGSGWYIRGDLGGTQLPQVDTSSTGTLAAKSATLSYSNAPSISLEPSNRIGYTGSLGGGYQFTPWLRADAVFDWHEPIQSSKYGAPFKCLIGYGLNPATTTTTIENGISVSNTTPASKYDINSSCNGMYQASLKSYDVLVNGYIDMGTWYNITPYIGAGIGLSFGHYQTSSTYTQGDGSSYDIDITDPITSAVYHAYLDRSASGQYYNFAFALMAGLSYNIYDHTKLDVGYRYLNLGTILGKNLATQEARVGLRYMIDN